VINCVCGEEVTLLLAGLDPAECHQCGACYDPRTGANLAVCELDAVTAMALVSARWRGGGPRSPAPD